MNRVVFACIFLFFSVVAQTQETPSETKEDSVRQGKQINIVYGANFTKDEKKFPGAFIFSKDTKQVQFEHQGADLWCDIAIHYQKENRLRAIGNVRLEQGDSIRLTGGKVDYNGETRLAKIYEDVLLKSDTEENSMTLRTDTLYFDREKQESYYNTSGTIIDSANTLTSEIGRYFMELKKYRFVDSVHIDNPEYILDSEQLDYYTTSKNAYMYGPSTITGETYKIYCERGFYDTKIESGYFIKNTQINYNDQIIEGDSLYFDQATEFASATNNVVVTDTVNKGVIKSHYAEVHKAVDSVFATKKAVSIKVVEQDSIYIHGDTLMMTGKPTNRIIRAFRNAKIFKTDLSGKCDSIHSNQRTGVTQLITDPILWNAENQITGDSIHIISNVQTEQLDSLKVLENAFIISPDTLGKKGYNQAKGINLFGKFRENELKIIDLKQNTEVIYYLYDEDDKLTGINKTICSEIHITLLNNDIEDLTFIKDPEGDISPEKDMPENTRKLKGFIWRGDERIRTKEDIFDADDNAIELVVIKGITDPIDIDAEKEQRSSNPADPVNNLPLPTRENEKGNEESEQKTNLK